MKIKRGVAICHYNRLEHLDEIVEAVKKTTPVETRIVICDDGSDDVPDIARKHNALLIQGSNLGVTANKNRALWAMQDAHYMCILEDDLKPTHNGWFETYERAAQLSGIHHFCRVQNKEVPESVRSFSAFLAQHDLNPIYGPSPRGDLTFLTSTVVNRVGGFNPEFRGAGYAHGEWSQRVFKAGLIGHPLKWVDIRQARDSFVQIGDTEGGRWNLDEQEIRRQLQRNKQVLRRLEKQNYVYHPLTLE